jgi:hypothetical protein
MATFVLIPGAGSDAWYWHLVVPELVARGHAAIPVDLPNDDDSAGLAEYADAVEDAIGPGEHDDLVLVAQSMGALTAPLVCDRRPVALMVLVAPLVPSPGEPPGAFWDAVGFADARRAAGEAEGWDAEDDDPATMFLHDVPDEVVAAGEGHVHGQSGTPFEAPWPLSAWPDVPTRVLACRHDRFFPLGLQRRVVAARLGITPDEMDGGHLPALHSPVELAARLDAYAAEVLPRPGGG